MSTNPLSLSEKIAHAIDTATPAEITHLVSERGIGRFAALQGELFRRFGSERVLTVHSIESDWGWIEYPADLGGAASAILIDDLGSAPRDVIERLALSFAPSNLGGDALVFVSDSTPRVAQLEGTGLWPARTIEL